MTAPVDNAPATPAAPADTTASASTTTDQGPTVTATSGTQSTETTPVTAPAIEAAQTSPREITPPTGAAPAAPPAAGNGKPAAEWSLDDFPPEIRDYVRGLRQENGENRVRAKTAEEQAAERFEQQRQEWVGGLLKSMGLITDSATEGEGAQVPPEQQITQLTEQLGERVTQHTETARELAIWKAAATAPTPANPQRLTDSRTFMSSIAGLDPSDDGFDAAVAEAITAAVTRDSYYAATPPAGQVPPSTPTAPPVSHAGEFAGGPQGGDATPKTVEDFRKTLVGRGSRGGNY